MAKYINADALMEEYNLDKATKYGNETSEEQSFSYSTMMMYEIADMIDNAPTADVRPNAMGEWLHRTYRLEGTTGVLSAYQCSECDFNVLTDEYNFCPCCGADMKGEEHE